MYSERIRPLLFRFKSDFIHDKTIQIASVASQSEWICNGIERIARGFSEAADGKVNGIRSSKVLESFEGPKSLLSQTIHGLQFQNPIGLAAGFDKNGKLPSLMYALGFGFVEIGSITAHPSSGNPLPRSFRLPLDHSLINRMGLNNEGAEKVTNRLLQLKKKRQFPIGINIAKTHDPSILGKEGIHDYQISYRLAESIADYITLNVSCPNTEEGKTFEDPEALDQLLSSLPIRASLPLWIKFSPDLERSQLQELLSVTDKVPIVGYVATNTSSSREDLRTDQVTVSQIGKGGLSGRAIRKKSTQLVEWIHQERPQLPIIGVGGIESLEDVIEKIRAGASLVQLYTALVHQGPFIAAKLNGQLLQYMMKSGYNSIGEIQNS